MTEFWRIRLRAYYAAVPEETTRVSARRDISPATEHPLDQVNLSSAYRFFPLRNTVTVSEAKSDVSKRVSRSGRRQLLHVRTSLLDCSTSFTFALCQPRFDQGIDQAQPVAGQLLFR